MAAALAAGAVVLGFRVVAPPPESSRAVVVVTRDLPAGAVLARSDLEVRQYAAALAPGSDLPSPEGVAGRILAGPLRSGEVVTRGRLVGPGLLADLPAGSVAVEVRTASSTAFLQPGRRVDAYLPGSPQPAASGALVLAVLPGDPEALAGPSQTSVVLAVPEGSAGRLAAGAETGGSAGQVGLAVR